MNERQALAVEDAKVIVDGSRELALRLLGADASEDNAVLSPLSLMTALAMTHAGAKDETAKELAGVLGLADLGSPRADAAVAELERQIVQDAASRPADRTMIFETANRVWVTQETEILGDYATTLKVHYHSAVGRVLSTKREESAKIINDWIKDRTHGLISKIVEPSNINPGGLILTNSIYFKARWAEVFPSGGTTPGPFTLATGKSVTVPMMNQIERFSYAEANLPGGANPIKVQVCGMPYEGGAEAVLLVPESPDGLDQIVKSLGSDEGREQMSQALSALGDRRVDITMPKFSVERTASVAEALKKLGLERAFSDAAQFPLMSVNPLKISDVVHGAKLVVDEKGTEAAAATAVIMAPTGAPPSRDEPVVVKADRPFLMIIRHARTGAWFFVAKVSNPAA